MAMFLVRITTPPFDALYELPPAVPSSPSMLATVTMAPRPPARGGCASIWVSTCLEVRKVPVRFTEITRSHSPASSAWTGPPPATPAALTSPSTRPPKPTAAPTRARTDASSATSTTDDAHVPRPVVRPSPTGAVGDSTRSAPITAAPSSSRRAAQARPMPEAEPVTM